MKIFIICSKAFYDKIKPIKDYLESKGYEVFVPHTYLNPGKEMNHGIMKLIVNLKLECFG